MLQDVLINSVLVFGARPLAAEIGSIWKLMVTKMMMIRRNLAKG